MNRSFFVSTVAVLCSPALAMALGIAGERWTIQERSSAFDGRMVEAVRGYPMPNSYAYFAATLRCSVDAKRIELIFSSYTRNGGDLVGEPYVTDFIGGPLGRFKARGSPVVDLRGFFSLNDLYINEISFMEVDSQNSFINIPDDLRGIGSDAINQARVIRDALPMALELNNRTGKYEVIINSSPAVFDVLRQCGGDGELVSSVDSANYRASQREAEKARQASERDRRHAEAKRERDRPAQYAAALQEAIARQWVRPDSVELGEQCRLYISQFPGGEVLDVEFDSSCRSDLRARRSLEAAVRRASPLPYRGFESVFSRRLELVFTAEDL